MGLQQLLNLIGTGNQLFKALNEATALQLKALLETKHLYQRVAVDAHRIVSNIRDRNYPAQRGNPIPEEGVAGLTMQRLSPVDEESSRSLSAGAVLLVLKHVKIFCSKCDSREAFRPVSFTEVVDPRLKGPEVVPDTLVAFQLFALGYQCQNCQGTPVGFLVRREGWSLILEGRSPMEQVEIPTFIPKKERPLFGNAIVAMNAGKTLAALFYLRTFIEQFARSVTGMTGNVAGDKIMASYSETLPTAQRDQMPSLREWYGRLSESLHAAREDAALFDEAREAIKHHFDIRRVFKIREVRRELHPHPANAEKGLVSTSASTTHGQRSSPPKRFKRTPVQKPV